MQLFDLCYIFYLWASIKLFYSAKTYTIILLKNLILFDHYEQIPIITMQIKDMCLVPIRICEYAR